MRRPMPPAENSPSSPNRLPWAEWERAIRRFESAWRQGERPVIDAFVAAAEAGQRPLLLELAHIDLEFRIKAGEAARVEEYLARYPALAADREAVLGLAAAECELRRRREPDLPADEYAARFPQYRDELPARLAGGPSTGLGLADVLPRLASVPARVPGYEVLGELGRGGMGVVYKARDLKHDRVVALKMIRAGRLASPAELARFRVEAEAVARLQHPHIIPIYEVGEHQGLPYFSMQLASGGSLADWLKRNPIGGPGAEAWDERQRRAAGWVAGVARAVQHAHRGGILHRDLKPANVLLDEEERPYVTDFGLAKYVENDPGLTPADAAVGTPSYMAPEQVEADGRLTPAVDVYALGAILYELLTGRPPFREATALATALRALRHEPEPPREVNPQVDAGLERVCMQCLSKTPRRRYATAHEVSVDLKRWLSGLPVTARPYRAGRRVLRKALGSLASALGFGKTTGGGGDGASDVAFSPDGKRVAAVVLDGTVKVWDADTNREIARLKAPNGEVTGVAFSPSGNRLAAVCSDGSVQIWKAGERSA